MPFQAFVPFVLQLHSKVRFFFLELKLKFLELQSIFVPIQMLTNGGPDQGSTNLIYYVYQTAFQFFHTGRAAACAIILTLVFAGLIALQNAIAEKMVHYEN